MNNLGGMVFIVAGLALGYWVITGRAQNFLAAMRGSGTGAGVPAISSSSAGGWGTPTQTPTPKPAPAPAPSPTPIENIWNTTSFAPQVPIQSPLFGSMG